MADGLNSCQFLGNCAADGELRATQSGQSVLNFRIAVNESHLDRDKQRKERVEFVSICIWGKRAEALAPLLTKGRQVFVSGSLRTTSYDDRDGNKRYKTECQADKVILCGGSRNDSGDTAQARNANRPGPARAGSRGSGASQAAPAERSDDGGGGYGGGSDDDVPF